MLNVLTGLYKIVNRNLGRVKPDFEIKKRVVGKSLYGVDVMPWAVHAAELRLWLQLVVESPLEPKDLRTYPLLPNLNMNLRVGDSLVQEIGGMTLHLRDPKLSEKIRKKLIELKQEKENYINNVPTAKFKRKEEVQKEEIRVFQEIIEERLQTIEDEIKSIRNKIKGEESQKTLSGEKATLNEERRKRIVQLQEQIERYNREEYELKKIREKLTIPVKKPFVWEIDFAEVFGEKAGFDIVIGNPPYVRQELISPPNKLKEEVSLEDKKEYKDKLQRSVQVHFPMVDKIDRKSDYYIYFYFDSLALLNPHGTFCFVTSNSWLDVDYGKELQEFLLKYVPIVAIYDNQAKRTFEHADINTIIAMFKAPMTSINMRIEFGGLVPEELSWPAFSNVTRFAMFKKPFEEVVNAKNLIELDTVEGIATTEAYRVYALKQDELLEDGWEYSENYNPEKQGRFKQGRYSGNKWGGKYLRAPDIFFTILEKGRNKLVKVAKVAHVRRGFTPGVNTFFYLKPTQKKASRGCIQVRNDVGWEGEIEKGFLQPVIKSPRESNSIVIDPERLPYLVFMCRKTKSELTGTKALEYIKWGEKQKTENGVAWNEVPTVSNRKPWYKLFENSQDKLIMPRTFNDRYICFLGGVNYSDRFYGIDNKDLLPFLNSSVFALFSESLAKRGLGLGALDLNIIEFNKIPVLPMKDVEFNFTPRSIFEDCGIDPSRPIREQEPNPSVGRKELDDAIFDELSLSIEERKEVYWAVCELVKNRLEKAESLKGKKNE
jgi:hypothetical protein